MEGRNPNILVKGKAVDELLHNIAAAWIAQFPGKARAYKQHLEQVRATNVVSDTRALSTEIPQELFFVIEAHIPGFFNNPDYVFKFQEYFQDGQALCQPKKITFVDRRTE